MDNKQLRSSILKYLIIFLIALLFYLFSTPPIFLATNIFPAFLINLVIAFITYSFIKLLKETYLRSKL